MRLIERLQAETASFHAEADADAGHLFGDVTAAEYKRYLAKTYGFVLPVEQALLATKGLERVIDTRRFNKHELLRRDLRGWHMSPADIDRIPTCTVPVLGGVEEALGWAFVVERATLSHGNLFRHLASVVPGDVAFTSSYLKCYVGTIGEMWKSFGDALEVAAPTDDRAKRVVDGATAAYRALRSFSLGQPPTSQPRDDQPLTNA